MKRPFLALLLGLIFSLAVLEVFLRVVGVSNLVLRGAREIPAEKLGRPNRVLILGNSYTVGMGAEVGESYPDQLQRLADEKIPGQVAVFTYARSAATTSFLLERLEENLERFHPTVVVAMIGQPNRWNRYGKDNYLRRVNAPGAAQLQKFWNHFAIYRFIAHLRIQSEDSFDREKQSSVRFYGTAIGSELLGYLWATLPDPRELRDGLPKTQLDEALAALEHLYAKGIDQRNAARSLAMLYFFQKKDSERALTWAENFLALGRDFDFLIYDVLQAIERVASSPSKQKAQSLLARVAPVPRKSRLMQLRNWFYRWQLPYSNGSAENLIFLRDANELAKNILHSMFTYSQMLSAKGHYEELSEFLKKCLERSQNPRARVIIAINLIEAARESGNEKLQKRVMEFIKREKVESWNIEAVNFSMARSEADWIFSDLKEMHRVLATKGIPLVLQTYPPNRHNNAADPADSVIRRFAASEEVVLSDTFSYFQEKFLESGKPEIFYPQNNRGDPHLNGAGYRLIAELLFKTLSSYGFIK